MQHLRTEIARTGFGLALAVAIMVAPLSARADYPERAITGIIPFGVGGSSDVMSRIVATGMAKELGQPIVMENKPGAGGNLGIGVVAHSKPDGYTILFCSIATTQNPATYRTLPYDPLKDIIPVTMFAVSPHAIGINTSKIPVKTLKELVELIQKNPGKYNIAAGGGGSQMSIQLFLLQNNLNMTLVPYNSSGEAHTALMGGETDLQIVDASVLAPGISAGKVRMLAVAGESRVPAYPDVPTTKEAGYPEFIDQAYIGYYVAAGTPAAIVNKLHEVGERVLASPEVAQRLSSFGYAPVSKSQKDFDTFYREEIARWKDVAVKGHIPPVD